VKKQLIKLVERIQGPMAVTQEAGSMLTAEKLVYHLHILHHHIRRRKRKSISLERKVLELSEVHNLPGQTCDLVVADVESDDFGKLRRG